MIAIQLVKLYINFIRFVICFVYLQLANHGSTTDRKRRSLSLLCGSHVLVSFNNVVNHGRPISISPVNGMQELLVLQLTVPRKDGVSIEFSARILRDNMHVPEY